MNEHKRNFRSARWSVTDCSRFRGVIYRRGSQFSNSEEWYESIPANVRPQKDQPFYHLLAENEETEYVAYVSEQNLLPDESGEPVRHPQIDENCSSRMTDGQYRTKRPRAH